VWLKEVLNVQTAMKVSDFPGHIRFYLAEGSDNVQTAMKVSDFPGHLMFYLAEGSA